MTPGIDNIQVQHVQSEDLKHSKCLKLWNINTWGFDFRYSTTVIYGNIPKSNKLKRWTTIGPKYFIQHTKLNLYVLASSPTSFTTWPSLWLLLFQSLLQCLVPTQGWHAIKTHWVCERNWRTQAGSKAKLLIKKLMFHGAISFIISSAYKILEGSQENAILVTFISAGEPLGAILFKSHVISH